VRQRVCRAGWVPGAWRHDPWHQDVLPRHHDPGGAELQGPKRKSF
jgi:hypothetical protein